MKMKQRILLGVLFLTVATSMLAQAPTALWGKSVQTAKTTGGSDIQMAPDGGLYVIGNASTRTEEEFVTLGSNNIAPGSLYRGTNENSSVQMIFLTKLSADGQPQWTVYSKDADVMSNSMFLQPTSDGVVAFLALRHVEKGSTHSPYFVDAASNKFSLDWVQETDDAKRYYIGVVMKLNNDGAIQWVRQLQAEHAVTTTGLIPYALAKDAAGCLYLAGQQRVELSLKKSDQTDAKIAPHNIPDGWNGSDSAGDLFVIKLDADGYYLNHLQTEGSSKFVSLLDMKYANGKLYAVGYVVPSADNHSISLGGRTMALSANNNTMPFSVCLNTDLTADWAQAYESSTTGFTMQQPTIHINKNHIWWAGMGATSLTTKTGKSLVIGENMNRVSTLLKIDAANGDLLDGYLKPLFQTGYFALMEDTEGYIYASGYAGVLTSKTNPNERKTTGSMYMDKFNSADLTAPVSSWDDMIKFVGGPTGIAFTETGRFYTLTRSQSIDNPLMGSSVNTGQTTTNFSINICAFQLPVTPVTAIRSIENIYRTDGYYYNLNGQRVEHPTKGIYIINGKKVLVK